MKPLCFVLMPFGTKADRSGREIDFNYIYQTYIKVAIERSGLEPIRADEELVGGIIHKPMYERLVLCEYAITDLTTLNANVFYELGLRHAIKRNTTISISAFDADLPFDVSLLRTLPYQLDEHAKLVNAEKNIQELVEKIEKCKTAPHVDSPVFQLVEGWKVEHNLSHEKTDAFREQAEYDNDMKDNLQSARGKGAEEVLAIYKKLQPIAGKSSGVIVDLFLSMRAVKAFEEMIDCYEKMDAPLQQVKMVQEQLGFALNRLGKHAEAEKVLKQIIEDYGFDPETNGLLGRVYKDQYFKAKNAKDKIKGKAFLNKAIQSYKEGFDADWRDAFPGINLVTLLTLKGDDASLEAYLPVVQFAVDRKIAASTPDYWDMATQSELSVIAEEYEEAENHLGEAILKIPDNENWMLETTLNNFQLIADAKKDRGEQDEKLETLIADFKNYTP